MRGKFCEFTFSLVRLKKPLSLAVFLMSPASLFSLPVVSNSPVFSVFWMLVVGDLAW